MAKMTKLPGRRSQLTIMNSGPMKKERAGDKKVTGILSLHQRRPISQPKEQLIEQTGESRALRVASL